MYTHRLEQSYVESNIFVPGQRFEVVDTFIYLGGTLASDGPLGPEIIRRIEKVSKDFGKLIKQVWSDRDISLDTKICVYESCALTARLYTSGTWTIYRHHYQTLGRVNKKYRRRI